MTHDLRAWRVDVGRQTLVLASDGGIPWAVYWGAPLPGGEDLAALTAAARLDLTGGMMDAVAPLSLCPEEAHSFPGWPGLEISGARPGRFVLTAATAENGGYTFVCAADDLELTFRVWSADASLDASMPANPSANGLQGPQSGCILLQTQLRAASAPHGLRLAAPVLPGPQNGSDIIDYSGRWIGEFQPVKTPWGPGARARAARGGRSGHEHPPFALFPGTGATNIRGGVYAFAYGWSGGHQMIAEELPDGRRQIQFASADQQVKPCDGGGFITETAPLYAVFSDQGINDVGVAFQRLVRDRLTPRSAQKRPRPVHYNCWESVYFYHEINVLRDIANRAADLGAERFVLDDGWFGRRDDDTSSLGDWTIDPRKWPDGLTPFIDHVHSLNMTFGLWVEPEMVNLNSDLARAHPDWILGPSDQTEGRGQRVLNLARADVRDHLFAVLDELLANHPIEYLKWDHNRLLPFTDSAQTDGIYDLLDRLRAAHPNVEIESCASGGGRIDYGILTRTGRVWLSDSNDALERLRIQHDSAPFLPLSVTGSHVGPRTCHTSGRVLDMRFRAWVAAQRHMGFEMDPRELTADETQILRGITTWWRSNRDWMTAADILRLDSPDPAIIAEQHLSDDGARFVVFAGQAATSATINPRPLRLTGLDTDAFYQVELITRADLPRLSRGPAALKEGPLTLSGAALMRQGLTPPWSFPETMHVIEGKRL